jgi:hypothetical protein
MVGEGHQKSMYDLPLPLSGLDEDGVEKITTRRPLRLQRQSCLGGMMPSLRSWKLV